MPLVTQQTKRKSKINWQPRVRFTSGVYGRKCIEYFLNVLIKAAPLLPLCNRKRGMNTVAKATGPVSSPVPSALHHIMARMKRKRESGVESESIDICQVRLPKRHRVAVVIENGSSDLRERMRAAVPMREIVAEIDNDQKPPTTLHEKVFGSLDLSDLSSSADEEDTEDEAYVPDKGSREGSALSTGRTSESEVEGQVTLAVGNDDRGQHDALNQGDSDSDYVNDDPQEPYAPGPSSRSHQTNVRAQPAMPAVTPNDVNNGVGHA